MAVYNHSNSPSWVAPSADVFAHIKQLDSLRAFAVGSVMLGHYFPKLNMYAEWGAIGINLFFVISGFLITGILLKCKKEIENGQSKILTLRQFYIRRFLRIFPLYYFVILLAVMFNFSDVRRHFWWYITYTVNYFGLITGKWIGLSHFWTLALEEQFYFIWPILILLVPRRKILLVPVAAIVIGIISRVFIVVFNLSWMALMVTPVCLDTLGLGALLAICSELRLHRVTSLLEKIGLWVGLPLLVGLKIMANFGIARNLGIVVFNISIGLFSVWLISRAVKGFNGVTRKILEWRPIRYLGAISYGIYVYHVPVMMIVYSTFLVVLNSGPSSRAVVSATLTIVVASLSWFLFERPINGLKKSFPYRLRGSYKFRLALSP